MGRHLREMQRFGAVVVVALAGMQLSGCELFSLFAGHGSNAALYNINPNARVLVMVDVLPPVSAPPTWATTLGERITGHLYRNKGIEHPLGQDRLIELQRDPRYAKAGAQDIAVAADADVLVYMRVNKLTVDTTVDGLVTSGHCEVLVKVIDRNGVNLWPGDPVGHSVTADVESGFSQDKDKTAVYEELTNLLTVRVGRMFHIWNPEDRAMKK